MFKFTYFTKLIIPLLAAAALLSGCWLANMPVYVPPHMPAQPVIDEPVANTPELPGASSPVRSRFTLRYEPAGTLNPITALNRDNINITSLLYESLFILTDNLLPVPQLCESWDTEDNITFTFTILPDIMMHDGEVMTADDVAYSIRQASQRGRHRAKLKCISSVSSDGELTVTVALDSANARFIRLLDIPVIRYDTMDSDLPPGSGPYIFPNPDDLRLMRFTGHRDFNDMPLSLIYLTVCNDGEVTEYFDRGDISLLWGDPTSSYEIRINRDHEPRFYATTCLLYLGFNAESGVLANSDVRRAIGCAVDRQYIIENIMDNPVSGQTTAAHVAISPVFDLYDIEWERRLVDPQREMTALLERSGLMDYDDDGLLEIYDGGYGIDFTLYFLVNIENTYKVAAAEHISASLRQSGFNIELRVLPWDSFVKALQDGDFNIYLGEVQLGADFDFSPLLLPGDGALNYGKTANSFYKTVLDNFLAAETREEVSLAGRLLCEEITFNAPFVPILYKRHAIYTPLGMISDETPTQTGVFTNFMNWDINLEQ